MKNKNKIIFNQNKKIIYLKIKNVRLIINKSR